MYEGQKIHAQEFFLASLQIEYCISLRYSSSPVRSLLAALSWHQHDIVLVISDTERQHTAALDSSFAASLTNFTP